MTKDEVYQSAREIPYGENRTFDLDWTPVDGELGPLVILVNKVHGGKGGSYSLSRRGNQITLVFHTRLT